MVDFRQSEEQMMVGDALRRFASDRYDVEKRHHYRRSAAGFDAGNWAALAEMGLIALPLSEEQGGLGGQDGDMLALMAGVGQGLVVEPVLSAVALSVSAVGRLGSDAQVERWLPGLIAGTMRWSAVLPDQGHGPVSPQARLEGDRLSASPALALDAIDADVFLFLADCKDGPCLVPMPANAPGLAVSPLRLIDGSIGAMVEARDVAIVADDILPIGADGLGQWIADGRFAIAAEMLGIMERLMADTLDYVRTRRQFGTEIGRFQTIQHRMARLYLLVEQSRSLLLRVVAMGGDEGGRRKAVDAAKAYIGDAAVHLAHECVQFHGGMGITDELSVGYGHRRITLLARLLGNPRAARKAYLAATLN